MRHAWIDASAGVAGDMLLGALVDAGADLAVIQAAVDAVVPGAVRLVARPVLRAGQSGLKLDVEVLSADLPERRWREIEALLDAPGLDAAALAAPVRERARATFARLAAAEAEVHGIAVADVHFHEVGALDSIADVVGVCAGLHQLGVETISAGPVAVGSGRIRTAHGDIGVPVPAVVRLAVGWRVLAGGRGELATPTGMALVVALSDRCEDLPPLRLSAAGAGAGSRDDPDRPNLTRVLIGETDAAASREEREPVVVLEANLDDLDPRLWPGVLARLLAAGARDAWLVPILMKHGRPAHTLGVLCEPATADALEAVVFAETPTLGVRRVRGDRTVLDRGWVDVAVDGEPVAVKVGHRGGRVVVATPEFAEVQRLAAARSEPARVVLGRVQAAAAAAGIAVGAPVPDALRTRPVRLPARPGSGDVGDVGTPAFG